MAKTFETTVHYLFHCPIFSDERSIFFNNIRSIDENVLSGIDPKISDMLLFGISSFNDTETWLNDHECKTNSNYQ